MFKFDPSLYRINPFCVYLLEEESGSIQWIGISKFTNILQLPDARRNPLFDTTFPPGKDVYMTIIATFSDKNKAQNFIYDWLRHNPKPFMMAVGWRTHATQQFVRCIETGEVFSTLTQAAEHFNVTQPYISKHLRGDPGCKFVQGQYTLEWTSDIPTHPDHQS